MQVQNRINLHFALDDLIGNSECSAQRVIRENGEVSPRLKKLKNW